VDTRKKITMLKRYGHQFGRYWLLVTSKHKSSLGVWYTDLVALTVALLVPFVVTNDPSIITIYGLAKWVIFCWDKRRNLVYLLGGMFLLVYFGMALQGIIITFFTTVDFFAAFGILQVMISFAKHITYVLLTYRQFFPKNS